MAETPGNEKVVIPLQYDHPALDVKVREMMIQHPELSLRDLGAAIGVENPNTIRRSLQRVAKAKALTSEKVPIQVPIDPRTRGGDGQDTPPAPRIGDSLRVISDRGPDSSSTDLGKTVGERISEVTNRGIELELSPINQKLVLDPAILLFYDYSRGKGYVGDLSAFLRECVSDYFQRRGLKLGIFHSEDGQ